MGIPEEDRGPRWLRDYGGFGEIAADITAMEEVAARLAADVQNNYAPHMTTVSDSMRVELPPPVQFPELESFLRAHGETQELTELNVYNFANGTNTFAAAAKTVSDKYRDSDAFAQAKVSDIDAAFQKASVPATTEQPQRSVRP